jgi:exodeoxyribonuclease VII small subunit
VTRQDEEDQAPQPTADQLLDRLEAVLHRLADPAAPLDRAVADYEEALMLLEAAESRLQAAAARVAQPSPG